MATNETSTVKTGPTAMEAIDSHSSRADEMFAAIRHMATLMQDANFDKDDAYPLSVAIQACAETGRRACEATDEVLGSINRAGGQS